MVAPILIISADSFLIIYLDFAELNSEKTEQRFGLISGSKFRKQEIWQK